MEGQLQIKYFSILLILLFGCTDEYNQIIKGEINLDKLNELVLLNDDPWYYKGSDSLYHYFAHKIEGYRPQYTHYHINKKELKISREYPLSKKLFWEEIFIQRVTKEGYSTLKKGLHYLPWQDTLTVNDSLVKIVKYSGAGIVSSEHLEKKSTNKRTGNFLYNYTSHCCSFPVVRVEGFVKQDTTYWATYHYSENLVNLIYVTLSLDSAGTKVLKEIKGVNNNYRFKFDF